jgi:hypothetical protein
VFRGPHPEDEITRIIRWAEDARINTLLLDMVLNGEMILEHSDEDGPSFKAYTKP